MLFCAPPELLTLVTVEFDDAVVVVDVAAMTHGVASSAAAIAMPATTDSCAVLVFILRQEKSNASLVFTGFPR
jgi:hypothetical protein